MGLTRWIATLLLALAPVMAAHAERDEAALGKGLGYPVGTASSWYVNPYRVGSWSAMDQVKGLPTRAVDRGTGPVTPLAAAAQPPAIGYRYRNLGYTLDD